MSGTWSNTPPWDELKHAVALGSGQWAGDPTWSDLTDSYGMGRVELTPDTVASWLGIVLSTEERGAMDSVVIAVTVTVTDWHGHGPR